MAKLYNGKNISNSKPKKSQKYLKKIRDGSINVNKKSFKSKKLKTQKSRYWKNEDVVYHRNKPIKWPKHCQEHIDNIDNIMNSSMPDLNNLLTALQVLPSDCTPGTTRSRDSDMCCFGPECDWHENYVEPFCECEDGSGEQCGCHNDWSYTQCISGGNNENLEFDHIIPFSKGGSNTYRNIQLLCESCNRSKSAKIG